MSNGETVEGANQENVAFPSGTCAERSACYYAHAQYPEARFEKIAVAARGTDGKFVPAPVAPCGACRQALLEYEMLAGKPVEVLLVGEKEVYRWHRFCRLRSWNFDKSERLSKFALSPRMARGRQTY